MDTIVRGTSVTIFAGIFCKVWSIPCAGSGLEQDAHDWPHITLVVSGSVRLTRGNGIVRDYVAGDVIQIPARQLHGFVTLTDNVQLACLHAINRADPKTLTETEN
jgi:quercetin dioxygenase-like cupin family protein